MASRNPDRPTSFQFIISQLEDQNYVPPENEENSALPHVPPEEFVPQPNQVLLPSEAESQGADNVELAEEAMEHSDVDSTTSDRDHDYNPGDSINSDKSDSASSDDEAGPSGVVTPNLRDPTVDQGSKREFQMQFSRRYA